MPRINFDEPDPKSTEDEQVRPELDDRFDPDDAKAEDGGVAARVARDPARDVDEEELAEEDILGMSELDDGEPGEGPDA